MPVSLKERDQSKSPEGCFIEGKRGRRRVGGRGERRRGLLPHVHESESGNERTQRREGEGPLLYHSFRKKSRAEEGFMLWMGVAPRGHLRTS